MIHPHNILKQKIFIYNTKFTINKKKINSHSKVENIKPFSEIRREGFLHPKREISIESVKKKRPRALEDEQCLLLHEVERSENSLNTKLITYALSFFCFF